MGVRLAEWMKANNITGARLAEEIGCSPSMVSQVLAGEVRFSPDFARKVKKVTLGAVSYDDLYDPPQKAS